MTDDNTNYIHKLMKRVKIAGLTIAELGTTYNPDYFEVNCKYYPSFTPEKQLALIEYIGTVSSFACECLLGRYDNWYFRAFNKNNNNEETWNSQGNTFSQGLACLIIDMINSKILNKDRIREILIND